VEQVYFEDVGEGQELPSLSMDMTVTKLVMAASATRDWQPMHHDRDYARNKSRAKDIFINTGFNMGMMCRAITDWTGPKAFITKLSFKMERSIYLGDTMTITGKVTGKRVEDGKNLVDVDLLVSNQDGPTTPASVTVELPLRG
jgi:acyl dehydratase